MSLIRKSGQKFTRNACLVIGFLLLSFTVAPQSYAQVATPIPLPTADVPEAATPTNTITAESVTLEPTPAATLRASSTPTPVLPDYLAGITFDLAFPETFWFSFQFTIPTDEFAAATLAMRQRDWSFGPTTVDIAANSRVVNETLNDFSYFWEIPAENPPRLFEEVEMTWEFIRNDGGIDTYTDRLLFADSRAVWDVARSLEGAITVAHPVGGFTSQEVATRLQVVQDLMRANTVDQTIPLKLIYHTSEVPLNPCVLNESREPVARAVVSTLQVPCDPASLLTLYAANDFTPIALTTNNVLSALDEGVKVLFDAYYGRLWADVSVPEWFRYGLRKFYTPGAKYDQLDIARSLSRTNGLIRDLNTIPQDPSRLLMWEIQSYGLVLYMAEQLGVDGLFDIARSLAAGQSLEAAYAEASESTLRRLTIDWGSWVFTDRAYSSYGYSPDLPITETPTETPTLTPTFTRTFTPSRTPTITPSITGIKSPTARPTQTFTATFTPSLTLRPADSTPSFIPTPGAANQNAVTGGNSALPLLIGGAALVIVVLVGLIVFALRRSRDITEDE